MRDRSRAAQCIIFGRRKCRPPTLDRAAFSSLRLRRILIQGLWSCFGLRREAIRQQGFETPADLDEIECFIGIGSCAFAAGEPSRIVVEQRPYGGDEARRIARRGDDSRPGLGDDFRGEIRRAHVDRDAANDELERLRANAAAEFSQASFAAERLGERARGLREEALPAAQKAYAAVQLAFNQGAASVLDVIDARRSLYAIETDTASALADAAKARAAWAAAVNRPDLP